MATQGKSRIHGSVYEVDVAEIEGLNQAERLGRGYWAQSLDVTMGTVAQYALTYIATQMNPELRPFEWYKQLVMTGAIKQRLPELYALPLGLFESAANPDLERCERHLEMFRQ